MGCFKQAVMVLRWFLDGTRLKQLTRDNNIGRSTTYRLLHEGIDVLAAQAPDLKTALERAAKDGLTHLNLDSTLIHTDRIFTPGPNGADPYWSGKHKHHGGNVQVISAPDGWPIWVSAVQPGREHDLTCARTHGLVEALSLATTQTALITLIDLGYEGAREMFRMPLKKPKGAGSLGRSARSTSSYEASMESANGRTLCSRPYSKPCAESASTRTGSPRSPPQRSSCFKWSTDGLCKAIAYRHEQLQGKVQ